MDASSHGNLLRYAQIQNSTFGALLYNPTNAQPRPDVRIQNSVIRYISGNNVSFAGAASGLNLVSPEGAEQVSEILCSSPLAGRARAGVAPGLVLLGDAAGFLDPITGGGMTQALVSAELLARHLSPLLVGALHACPDSIGAAPSETLDRALRTFDRARQSYLRDYRFLTAMVLWLADHPLLTERFLALLRSAPPLFTHLIGVSGGVRRLFGMPLARSL